MLGIIYKDFYECFLIKKNALNWLVAVFMIIVLTVCMKTIYVFMLNVAIVIPLCGTSALQFSIEQDEISNFDKIQLTFPITIKEIVLAKYILGLMIQGMTFICSFILTQIYVYGFKLISLQQALPIWMTGIVISLLFFSISYIGFFILGNKKGTILYLIILVIIALSYMTAAFNIGVKELLLMDKTWLLLIGVMIAVIALIASYFISLKIYTKRHS